MYKVILIKKTRLFTWRPGYFAGPMPKAEAVARRREAELWGAVAKVVRA